MEFFIKEDGMSIEDQLRRNELVSIRIGKITDVIYEKKPSKVLPFKGKFPIVDSLDAQTFLDRTMEHHKFSDLPNDIKSLVRKAEKVKWLDISFNEYLKNKGIGIKQFKEKNPKTKQDILYDWLFSNKIDIGILEL